MVSKDPEKAKATRRRWVEAHPEQVREQQNRWAREHPDKVKLKRRKSTLSAYGMSLEDYNAMFEAQEGCCAICGRHQSELDKILVIDHNHDTGEVRRLLCSACNAGIGMFQEDVNLLLNAIEYLRQFA